MTYSFRADIWSRGSTIVVASATGSQDYWRLEMEEHRSTTTFDTLLYHPQRTCYRVARMSFKRTAQGSPYPLVHVFSLPDVFCPVQFGGQEDQEDQEEQEGLAHDLARSLAKQRPLAAEFLTEEVEDKERRMYHRWMAAWHERSPRAPKATRTRFEMMEILRKHCQNGRRLFGQVQGDDNNRYDRDYYYSRGGGGGAGGGREGYNSIPHVGSDGHYHHNSHSRENKEGGGLYYGAAFFSPLFEMQGRMERAGEDSTRKGAVPQSLSGLGQLAVDGDQLQRKEEHRQSWEYGYGQKRDSPMMHNILAGTKLGRRRRRRQKWR
ncbi:hypothetical protein BKA57DRAFT_253698 [Linnemannia elongata]|nr:hypothetical protein BKA57DRAFT_253698 [Linnemannia elongata]